MIRNNFKNDKKTFFQEAFNILHRYNVDVDREYYDQVDNLSHTFTQLLNRALQSQCQLLGKYITNYCLYETI